MTWIDTISYDAATGHLSRLYDRIKGPGDNVDNIMLAHSLRPHTMEGHMALTNRYCITRATKCRGGFWKR